MTLRTEEISKCKDEHVDVKPEWQHMRKEHWLNELRSAYGFKTGETGLHCSENILYHIRLGLF